MCAVDIGIGHDHDPFIAQLVQLEIRPRATAQCLDDIFQFLILL